VPASTGSGFTNGVRAIKIYVILLAAAFFIATSSCAIQRHGPDQAIYCSLGKTRDGFDIFCPEPVLNGGWPAPFAFDRPGISVEDRISFFEDDLRAWPFIADVAFYFMLLLALWCLLRYLTGARRS
jgi:hypothetical protein